MERGRMPMIIRQGSEWLKRQPPIPIERPKFSEVDSRLISFPVLNGLHHQYFRVAA